MKLLVLAFIVSISLHFIFFKNYVLEKEPKEQKQETQNKKSSIHYVKIKKNPQKVEVAKPEVKKTVQKNNNTKVLKPKEAKKKIVKPVKKPDIKKIVKKDRKKVIPLNKKDLEKAAKLQNKMLDEQIVNKKTSIQKSTLENFLSQEEPVNNEMLSEILKLYGKEYETFTKVQKAFIEKNHNSFQVITQRVLTRLGYPRLARKLRLSGTNIVEFVFYPDGSIKNLKITKSSGYSVFDKYTLNLIEIAYKDYPRPKTATKLKFNVRYIIY